MNLTRITPQTSPEDSARIHNNNATAIEKELARLEKEIKKARERR